MKVFDPDRTEKRQLLVWMSMATILIGLMSILSNLIIEIDLPVLHISYTAVVIYTMLAIIIKRGLWLSLAEYIFVIVSLVFINMLWLFNYGHNGPALFHFVLIFSIIIFLWKGKKLFIASLVIIINLIILCYIEYNYPDIVGNYDDRTFKIFDIYLTLLTFLVLFYALMRAVKISYLREYEKAKQSDKLKSSFLENINHEIRTPLNAIIGFSSLISDDTITRDQVKEYSELIDESNEALLRIIDDIILVSSLESGEISSKSELCNLDNLMASLHKTFKHQLIKKKKPHIKLNVSEPNITDEVFTDKIRVQQVFIRLMDNAIKFTEKGSITFGYRVGTEEITFYIADTGIGIPSKYGNRVFERFYKINNKHNTNERGTGVGLYICKKIIDSMGGTISYSSDVGKGTAFSFTIPREKTSKHD